MRYFGEHTGRVGRLRRKAVGLVAVSVALVAGACTTPTTPPTTTPPPPPDITNAALVRVTPITATLVENTTYTFRFTVRNTGPTACIPYLVVVLHRLTPSWSVADRTEPDVCLTTGQTHETVATVDLGQGRWVYSAQWLDRSGTYRFFQDPAPVESTVDTTPPPAPSGVSDTIKSGTWNVRQTINGAVTGTLSGGQGVFIQCQTVGPAVTVSGFGTSTIYDYVTSPLVGWVSDLAMTTTPYAVRDPRLPACEGGAPAPPPVTSAAQAAANWAIAEKNSPDPTWSDQANAPWSGLCELFAEVAYGTRGRMPSAIAHYNLRLRKGQIRTDTNPPVGAFVFYGGGQGYGHVGISIGNGQVISTQGFSGQRLPVRQHAVTALSNPYLGWAPFDGTWS